MSALAAFYSSLSTGLRFIRYLWALPNTLVGLLFVPAAMLPGAGWQVVGSDPDPRVNVALRRSRLAGVVYPPSAFLLPPPPAPDPSV